MEELDCFPIPFQSRLHGLVEVSSYKTHPDSRVGEKHIPKAGNILFG